MINFKTQFRSGTKIREAYKLKYQLLVYLKKVMSKNTSILLGDRYEKFIAKEVSNGKYNSAIEVIRTALRLLEEDEEMKNILRKALVTGERSGFVENFGPEKK
jgi:antitoxin ParD1/3/4